MPRWDGAGDPGPCERRTDGDRITELIPVTEWLNDKTANQLIRRPGDAEILPNMLQLPRTKYRDHMHDRNREHSAIDTANPGITTYVRVSRRVSQEKGESTVEEDKLLRRRKELRDEALQQELKLQIEKNEILELRSLGIRTAMQKYKDLQDTDQDGGRAHSHDGVSKVSQQSAFFM